MAPGLPTPEIHKKGKRKTGGRRRAGAGGRKENLKCPWSSPEHKWLLSRVDILSSID